MSVLKIMKLKNHIKKLMKEKIVEIMRKKMKQTLPIQVKKMKIKIKNLIAQKVLQILKDKQNAIN